MDHLQDALGKVHAALVASEPQSEVQRQLAEAQTSLLQYIWLVTAQPHRREARLDAA